MKSLNEYIKEKQSRSNEKGSSFQDYFTYLMNKHGFEDNATLYKKANITKQTFSNIYSGKSVPSIKNLIKLVFTMRLTNRECKYLFKKAGYTLPSSSEYALIVRYCIENEIYDLARLNEFFKERGIDEKDWID